MAEAGVHRNITIENNTFHDLRGPAFVITSTEGLRIANNRIIDSQHKPHLGSGESWGVDGASLGWLKYNTNVKIEHNEIRNRGPYGTNDPFVIIQEPGR